MDSEDNLNKLLPINVSLNKLLKPIESARAKDIAYKNANKNVQKKDTKSTSSNKKNEGEEIYPSWPNSLGAIPNLFLRSALFGINESNKSLMRERIIGPPGYEIYVTGTNLCTKDLNGLDYLFSIADENDECRFTEYSFLKLKKVNDSKDNRVAVKCFFSRVMANSIEIIDRNGTNCSYEGSFIIDKYTNENTREIVIKLNPLLRRFFRKDGFTFLHAKIYKALVKHPLAFWLFGYYSSHAEPYPIKVTTIFEMCRSGSKSKGSFMQCLKKALKKLESVSVQNEKTFKWTINKGLVTVEKSASNSQAKHIENKLAANAVSA